MRLVWTQPALRDLAAARAYIARDNQQAADRQLGIVLAAIATLREFPAIGRPGRRARTRELVIGKTPYVVPYRVRGDAVEILRVLHGRQLWPDDS